MINYARIIHHKGNAMKTLDKNKLKNLEEFSKSIISMYVKLANFEIEGKMHTDEYMEIIKLIPTVKRIERKKIEDLHISDSNYEELITHIINHMYSFDIAKLLDTQENVEYKRINNLLAAYSCECDCFLTDEELNNPRYGEEYKNALIDRKYLDSYQNALDVNIIFMLQYDIDKLTDEELKNYFIYLKYFNIYVNPDYEAFFAERLGKLHKPININSRRYEVPDYSEEDYDMCNRDNLTTELVDDIIYLLKLDDEYIKEKYERLDFARELSVCVARLISLQDKDFIVLIEKTISKLIDDNPEYQNDDNEEIRQHIAKMFADSYVVLDDIQKKKLLELK